MNRVAEIELKESFWKSQEVILQSMTSLPVAEVEASRGQILQLIAKGCGAIRLSLPTMKDVEYLSDLISIVKAERTKVKFIADVHFDVDIAIEAAKVADKVRINPGNFLSRRELAYSDAKRKACLKKKIEPLINTCKAFSTTLRIGVNQGSVYKGNKVMLKASELVDEILEYADIIRALDFHDLVLSIKSSDPWLMIESNKLLSEILTKKGWNFPIHLGVTEAGNEWEGRIKSALGIGTCLINGIGNTVRVSLTEDPVNEIPVAKSIVHFSRNLSESMKELVIRSDRVQERNSRFDAPIVLHELSGEIEKTNKWSGDIVFYSQDKADVGSSVIKPGLSISFDEYSKEIAKENGKYILIEIHEAEKILTGTCNLPILVKFTINGAGEEQILSDTTLICHLLKKNLIDGIYVESQNQKEYEDHLSILSEVLFQGGGRQVKSSVISCPGCARSGIDLERVNRKVKELASDKELLISVMGCGINGYGEMMKSDIGLISSSPGKVDIYKQKKLYQSAVAEVELGAVLNELISDINEC